MRFRGVFFPKETQISNKRVKKTAGRERPRSFWLIERERMLLYPFAGGVEDLTVGKEDVHLAINDSLTNALA